ncbi:MAG: phosphoglucosamine mutase [Candidatus Bathyarchaeia archaeon]
MKTRLFGSSGARGLINVELTPILAAQVGLAVAGFSRARGILIARDTRISGSMLEDALVSGSSAGGATALCIGVVPTPVLAFLTKELRADAGVMITASHNPPQYNGIKIFDHNGLAYGEKNQNKIEKVIENQDFAFADWQTIGQQQHVDKSSLYVEMIKKNIMLKKKWHTILDPGCGATYNLAPTVFNTLGCKVTAINAQPDGCFPARSSEPNSESLKSLAKIVKELGADAGAAYDGDGDRVAFIDEKGSFVDFDRVLAAYAAYVIRKRNGGVAVTNVEASMCFDKMVEKEGGKVIRTKVGDIYVSEAMKTHRAIFGGEPCGAWIHPEFHLCPDGILSSILLLKALEEEDKTLSEFASEAPRYEILRRSIACKNEMKHRIVKDAGARLKKAFPKYKDFSVVDGIRLASEDGWVLVRASGTEPLVRLTVEAKSMKTAKEMMNVSVRLVKESVGGKKE